MSVFVLLGLAILAYACTRMPERIKPAWSRRLTGWQKVFGLVAVVLAVLIVINPELFALGLLGDSAFFDALVLLLSLQLQMVVARAWHGVCAGFAKMMRVMVPRMSMSFSLVLLALAPVGNVVSTIQKAVHRISS